MVDDVYGTVGGVVYLDVLMYAVCVVRGGREVTRVLGVVGCVVNCV